MRMKQTSPKPPVRLRRGSPSLSRNLDARRPTERLRERQPRVTHPPADKLRHISLTMLWAGREAIKEALASCQAELAEIDAELRRRGINFPDALDGTDRTHQHAAHDRRRGSHPTVRDMRATTRRHVGPL